MKQVEHSDGQLPDNEQLSEVLRWIESISPRVGFDESEFRFEVGNSFVSLGPATGGDRTQRFVSMPRGRPYGGDSGKNGYLYEAESGKEAEISLGNKPHRIPAGEYSFEEESRRHNLAEMFDLQTQLSHRTFDPREMLGWYAPICLFGRRAGFYINQSEFLNSAESLRERFWSGDPVDDGRILATRVIYAITLSQLQAHHLVESIFLTTLPDFLSLDSYLNFCELRQSFDSETVASLNHTSAAEATSSKSELFLSLDVQVLQEIRDLTSGRPRINGKMPLDSSFVAAQLCSNSFVPSAVLNAMTHRRILQKEIDARVRWVN